MTTTSPSLTLRSWQGPRTLILLCAVAFPRLRRRVDHERGAAPHPDRTALLDSEPAGGCVGIPSDLANAGVEPNRAGLVAAAALIALATTYTRQDPDAAHGADLEPDQPHTAIGTEPLTQEI